MHDSDKRLANAAMTDDATQSPDVYVNSQPRASLGTSYNTFVSLLPHVPTSACEVRLY
jgi:hypothetical protein